MAICPECGSVEFACTGCGTITRTETPGISSDTIKADLLVRRAGGEAAIPEPPAMPAFPTPLVVDTPAKLAVAVDAILYYEDTADRIMTAATAIAEQHRAKAEFLRHAYEPQMIGLVARETSGKKCRYLDVVTTQRDGAVRVQVRAKPERLAVVNADACLAWLLTNDIARAVRTVPEQVIAAEMKIDVNGLSAWHKATGQVPAGCELEEEHDTVKF